MLMVSLLLLLNMTGIAGAEGSGESVSPNLTPEQWAGHTFVFLDLASDKRAEGYDIYPEDQADKGFQGDLSVRIPYGEHVGKQVTITEVVKYTAGDYRYDYVVHMKENATGKALVGRTMSGQMEGLVLEEDLLKARQQFMGKTVYTKRRMLQGAFDPQANTAPAAVTVKVGGAVQVTDVYAGLQAIEPIWLIVSVNGQKAILPIAYSWTNMPVFIWTETPPWQDELFMDDPRVKLGWSEAIWQQIESGTVQEGMTKEQVRLSWGPPARVDEINCGAGKTVWNYGAKILTFSGEILTAIASVEAKDVVMP